MLYIHFTICGKIKVYFAQRKGCHLCKIKDVIYVKVQNNYTRTNVSLALELRYHLLKNEVLFDQELRYHLLKNKDTICSRVKISFA